MKMAIMLKSLKKNCEQIMNYLFNNVKTVNDSKIFAALVILTLNLSSKFITLPISKTMESFVKNSFSQYVLVFAMSWVGTRDIFISVFVTIVFGVFMEFILNEKSAFCCLSEGFVTTQIDKLNKQDNDISKEEVETATKTFKKALKTLEKFSNLESKKST
jgi:hypothetical protein